MKKFWLLAAVLIALGLWLWSRRPAAPEVPFAKVKREKLESTLQTNGKVEPSEWTDVRAERAGLVEKVFVEKGRRVAKGAPIVELDAADARSELAAAEARIAQVKAEIENLERGGNAAQLAEISSALEQARQEREAAQKEYQALRRLLDKKAATAHDVEQARQRVEKADLQIRALETKRAALVTPADKSVARARLRDAETAAQTAQRRIALSVIRSPMEGILYNLETRSGAYLILGQQVAQVGRLDRVRVRVYVDEPDLGRVEEKQPVTITWDALPGRKWSGAVERVPTEVTALGTRQVGEVICMIENPDHELLPGTNINAEILSKVVAGALTIPKEALRKEGDELGVFRLEGDRVVWRAVKVGASSLTRTEITGGVVEGDSVALPTEAALKSGEQVRAVYQ